MKVQINEDFKRDGLHETPLALQDSESCEAKRAPSLRESRFAKRQTRAIEMQAWNDKVITAPTSEQKPNHDIDMETNKDVSPWPNVQVPQHRKTFTPADQQEQPHSGLSRAQSSSLEGDLRSEFCSNQHATRETNLSTMKREQKQPIQQRETAKTNTVRERGSEEGLVSEHVPIVT